MDLASIVEYTERTDGRRRESSIPPFNFVEAGGL